MARVLTIEPFYGGSHKAFVDGLISTSAHEFRLLTHPPCFWKWRMRGAALTMADKANALDFQPHLVLASDMLSLAEFRSLYKNDVPAILYMHENQLCYPSPQQDHRDLHFGFTNISSCMAASMVLWNSSYHMASFMAELPRFVSLMPDQRPGTLAERIKQKSRVIYPGVDLESIEVEPLIREGPPLVLWNHRWEFDKRPQLFFNALYELERRGMDFKVAVLGESFQAKPEEFLDARQRLGKRVARFGYVEGRREYARWLRRCSVSVSTAEQENFGIAAVEAAYAGARPLWPDALSYPELLSATCGDGHLYSDFGELVLKLEEVLRGDVYDRALHKRHAKALSRFDWSRVVCLYDDIIEEASLR